MTKEETLKRIEIMQAYCNGNPVQILTAHGWQDIESPNWNGTNYRIKPTSKYRPFSNKEEYIQEAQKHPMPGWVKWYDNLESISEIDNHGFTFKDNPIFTYKDLLYNTYFTFVDDSPLGILINN
mgnify:CR=1 FL=1